MILRTPRDLGALIRQKRQDAKMAQKTLAEKVGVSRWWINEIESGKPRAEFGLVLQTLAALGLELSAVELTKMEKPKRKSASLEAVLARARGISR